MPASLPTNVTERLQWYRWTATETEVAAALRDERSPKIISTMIGSTLPSQRERLLAVAYLATKPKSQKYGRAIERGLYRLADEWVARTSGDAVEAMQWLVNPDNLFAGKQLFTALFRVVNIPTAIDYYTTHPDPEIRREALASAYVSEHALLAAVAAADPTSPEGQSTLRVVSGNKSTSGYTPALAEAILAKNYPTATTSVLTNPRTRANIATRLLIGSLNEGNLAKVGRLSIPALYTNRGEEAAHGRLEVATYLLNTDFDTSESDNRAAVLDIVYKLTDTNPRGLPEDTTTRLIARWLPVACTSRFGSQVETLVARYARDYNPAVTSNLPTPEALCDTVVTVWLNREGPFNHGQEIPTFISTGLLSLPLAEQAIDTFERQAAESFSRSRAADNCRIAAIKQTAYPVGDVVKYVTDEETETAALTRLVAREPMNNGDYATTIRVDINAIMPLLSRKAATRTELQKWMAYLAGLDHTDVLHYLATHENVAIRRTAATCMTGYKIVEPPRYTYGINRVMSDDMKTKINTAQREALTVMLDDKDPTVRRYAVSNPLLGLAEVLPFRSDKAAPVRKAAATRFLEGLAT